MPILVLDELKRQPLLICRWIRKTLRSTRGVARTSPNPLSGHSSGIPYFFMRSAMYQILGKPDFLLH